MSAAAVAVGRQDGYGCGGGGDSAEGLELVVLPVGEQEKEGGARGIKMTRQETLWAKAEKVRLSCYCLLRRRLYYRCCSCRLKGRQLRGRRWWYRGFGGGYYYHKSKKREEGEWGEGDDWLRIAIGWRTMALVGSVVLLKEDWEGDCRCRKGTGGCYRSWCCVPERVIQKTKRNEKVQRKKRNREKKTRRKK